MTITIVGLGPGSPDQLTRAAWDVLRSAGEVYLRTRHHPTVDALVGLSGLTLESFDDIYEAHEDFADVYQAIAARVLELGVRPDGVVYAVPGHPCVGEATTRYIVEGARSQNLSVRVIDGLSFLEPTLRALHLDALDGLQVADAMLIAARYHTPLDPDRPAIVAQLYSRMLASELKIVLLNTYPDEHPVTLVRAAGTSGQTLQSLPLHELDHSSSAFDHLTALYLPPLTKAGGYDALQEIVAHLRAPEGCPWDREQTHESLISSLLEEAYETVAAIESGETALLVEELGDLYLNLAMQVQIAAEEGEFRLADVVSHVVTKLIRRHPHVFGDVAVDGVEQVLSNWETIKQAERQTSGAIESTLGTVPQALPALMQAQTYQRRAARVGWPGAVRSPAAQWAALGALENTADETTWGDLLFALAEQARHQGVDAERALRLANARFAAQVHAVEAAAAAAGTSLGSLPGSARAAFWPTSS